MALDKSALEALLLATQALMPGVGLGVGIGDGTGGGTGVGGVGTFEQANEEQ